MTPDMTPRRPSFEALVVQHSVEVDTVGGGAQASAPLRLSRGRQGVGPSLALTWSGGGHSPFGRGWQLGGPGRIELDTARGVPRYRGADRVMFGGTRLVPVPDAGGDPIALANPLSSPAPNTTIERWRGQGGSHPERFERWTIDGRIHWLRRRRDAVIEVYGEAADDSTRIVDPDDPKRVAAWLLEAEFHPRGDVVRYLWRKEDFAGVDRRAMPEMRRDHPGAQRYPDRIQYGNATPASLGDDLSAITWRFQVVFDYGDLAEHTPTVTGDWLVRPDVSTSHRTGFEVRTRRRCQRVLMCHHFAEIDPDPVVVLATELTHDDDGRITSITERGYRHGAGGVTEKARPPLTLTYETATWGDDFVDVSKDIAACDAARGSWVDLYGEGLPGLLTQSGSIWSFRRNLGAGRYGPPSIMHGMPRASAEGHLVDLDGDGSVEWVRFGGATAGMQRFDRREGRWHAPRQFKKRPRVNAADGGVQFVDLTGDGRPDLVVDRGREGLLYFPFLGPEGFGDPIRVERRSRNSGGLPTLDGSQPYIYLADMTGDGLTDVVEVRGGRVEYWPNLGHGRFGAGVVMADPPRLPRSHEKARVRLVDLDGTGAAGLLYIGDGELRYWPNVGGDRFGAPRAVKKTPRFVRPEELKIVDVGDGLSRMAWHDPTSSRALRALTLNDGGRPGMLSTITNGVGLSHQLTWRWSGEDLLRDRDAGRGWTTRLPRHRPVVASLEAIDGISGDRRITRYDWHDGEFDEDERTVAGFARVDIWEGDPVGAAHDTPGLLTRLWQSTGLRHDLSNDTVDAWGDAALLPSDLVDLGDLPRSDVHRAALRQLRGAVRRQEMYAVGADGEPATDPVRVVEAAQRVRQRQGGRDEGLAAFEVYEARRVEAEYGADPADPRIRESLVLAVDDYGAVTRRVIVDHGRGGIGLDEQQATHAIATVSDRTTTDTVDCFEASLEHQTRTYEVNGVADSADLAADVETALAATLDFGVAWTDPPVEESRLLEWTRNLYYDAAQAAASAVGTPLTAPGLLHHTEHAVLPDGAANDYYGGRLVDADLGALADGYRWVSEPVYHYDDIAHFHRLLDETAADGGQQTYGFAFDDMALASVTDGTGVPQTAEHDPQAWAVSATIDGNDIRHEVRYDPLGLAIVECRRGTYDDGSGAVAIGADDLANHVPVGGATLGDVLSDPIAHLQGARGTTFYTADAVDGVRLVTLTREVHYADDPGATVAVRVEAVSLDGFGRVRRRAVLADAGDAITRDGGGAVALDGNGDPVLAAAATRWWVDAQTRIDHRGLEVEAFGPFFDTTPWSNDLPTRTWGRDTLAHYDAVGRAVRVDYRNGTHSAVAYEPWQRVEEDVHDTVVGTPYEAARSGLAGTDPEYKALEQALDDQSTPTVIDLDARGRAFQTTRQGTGGAALVEKTTFDARGEPQTVTDARDLTAFVYHRDMLGRALRTENIDAGTKWQGFDLTGRPSDAWDARNVHLQWSYDLAGRLLTEQATVDGGAARVTERRRYGEGAGAADTNTRGRLDLQHDDAGTVETEGYDIDGAPIATVRILRADYTAAIDWVDPTTVVMDGTSHRTEWERDALGRETRMVAADSVAHLKTYDRLGGLTSYVAEEVGGAWTEDVVDGASYDARGRRTALSLANGVSVDAEFDTESHHLARLHAYSATDVYFDIRRAYSPLGQVVLEADDAHAGGHSELIQGLTASAERAYKYDTFGRLKSATGRVHSALAQGEGRWGGTWGSRTVLLSDGQAVERYQRNYTYNDNGTLTSIQHVGPGGPKWTEAKWVAADSNRSMSQHDFGEVPALAETSAFDAAGHCVRMRHLRTLEWDIAGRLAKITLIERLNEPDEAEFYSYDGDDQRVRRVHHRLANGDLEITDVVYLPGCEIRKVTWNGNARLERKTSGFTVDGERIGELSRWSQDDNQTETDDINDRRMVFRLGGTMGSFGLDLDASGDVLTYEEYFPYGGVAFIGTDDARTAKLRSYRYRGKLRDDATGLYYYGYRYYAPWIGNWISPDPLGPVDGLNVYQFVQGDPVNKHDPDGRQTSDQNANIRTDHAMEQALRREEATRKRDMLKAAIPDGLKSSEMCLPYVSLNIDGDKFGSLPDTPDGVLIERLKRTVANCLDAEAALPQMSLEEAAAVIYRFGGSGLAAGMVGDWANDAANVATGVMAGPLEGLVAGSLQVVATSGDDWGVNLAETLSQEGVGLLLGLIFRGLGEVASHSPSTSPSPARRPGSGSAGRSSQSDIERGVKSRHPAAKSADSSLEPSPPGDVEVTRPRAASVGQPTTKHKTAGADSKHGGEAALMLDGPDVLAPGRAAPDGVGPSQAVPASLPEGVGMSRAVPDGGNQSREVAEGVFAERQVSAPAEVVTRHEVGFDDVGWDQLDSLSDRHSDPTVRANATLRTQQREGTPLRRLHPDASLRKSSLDHWRGMTTDDIVDSLTKPGSEKLTIRPDGTVLQGNHRVKVLEERGFDTSTLFDRADVIARQPLAPWE